MTGDEWIDAGAEAVEGKGVFLVWRTLHRWLALCYLQHVQEVERVLNVFGILERTTLSLGKVNQCIDHILLL